MIRLIALPALVTLISFCTDLYLLKRKTYWKYPAIFFSCSMLQYCILNTAEANPYYYEAITDNERNDFKKKSKWHFDRGTKCFNDAYNSCLLIPNADDRDIAKQLIATCLWSIGQGTIRSTAIMVLLQSLATYSFYVYENYYEMERLYNESKYHFEMHDFYFRLSNHAN